MVYAYLCLHSIWNERYHCSKLKYRLDCFGLFNRMHNLISDFQDFFLVYILVKFPFNFSEFLFCPFFVGELNWRSTNFLSEENYIQNPHLNIFPWVFHHTHIFHSFVRCARTLVLFDCIMWRRRENGFIT